MGKTYSGSDLHNTNTNDTQLTFHFLDSKREGFLVLELKDERLPHRVAVSAELFLEAECHLVSVVGLVSRAFLLQEFCLKDQRPDELPLRVRVVWLHIDLQSRETNFIT